MKTNIILTKCLFLCIALFSSSPLKAQGEVNIWHFGRKAGVDFNSGSPVTILNNEMDTGEGCSTISDASGALLFYTDGISVWNKQHLIMPNGTGLLGNVSSTQSAIIVPKPNEATIYYIFTVDSEAGSNGMRYSEIDMSLDNGNGAVTSLKNIFLANPTTEKLSAIQHANGIDFWVVTHEWNSNRFLSFRVTPAGVTTSPTVSSSGMTHNGGSQRAIGYLKISPNGERLALALSGQNSFVEIFNFNTTSGIVSNPISINDVFSLNGPGAYGVEFSPDSQLLYVSDLDFSANSIITQLDLSFNNATDIINSRTILFEGPDIVSAMQLGPDGKIYLANNAAHLDVIENPNTLGTGANYINREVDLLGRNASLSLPAFVQSNFNNNNATISFQVDKKCTNSQTEFTIDSSEPILSILWDFGDGTTSNDENPLHIYAASGTYSVTATVTSQNGSNTATQQVVINNTPTVNDVSDYILCDDPSNDMMAEFDLNTKITEIIGNQDTTEFDVAFYESFSNAENDINRLPLLYTNTTNSQEIFTRIFSILDVNCFAITNLNLIVIAPPIANAISDIEICNENETIDLSNFNSLILGQQTAANFSITYHLSQQDADTNTNPLPFLYQTNTNPQTIFVRIETNGDSSCYDTNLFLILISNELMAFSPDDLVECNESSTNETALFDLSSQELAIINGQTGTFIITYHISQIDANADINPLDNNYSNVTNPQTIFVRLEDSSNDFCFDITSFEISTEDCTIFIPQGFSPNKDNINETFEITNLLNTYEDFNLQIFNRNGSLVYKGGNEEGFWDGIPNTGFSNSGNIVPVGLYYYILIMNDPNYNEPFTGSVYVNY